MKKLLLLAALVPAVSSAVSVKVEVKYFKDVEFTKAAKHVVEYGNDLFAEIVVMEENEEFAKLMVTAKKRLPDGTEQVCCENVIDAPYGQELKYGCKKTGSEFNLIVSKDSISSELMKVADSE